MNPDDIEDEFRVLTERYHALNNRVNRMAVAVLFLGAGIIALALKDIFNVKVTL